MAVFPIVHASFAGERQGGTHAFLIVQDQLCGFLPDCFLAGVAGYSSDKGFPRKSNG
jgi:hypothetical protein